MFKFRISLVVLLITGLVCPLQSQSQSQSDSNPTINLQWFPLNKLRSPKSSDSKDMRVSQLWKEIQKRESIA